MSASSVAIISFVAVLFIIVFVIIYKYNQNKTQAGDNDDIIFKFNIEDKDSTSDSEFVLVKNVDIKQEVNTDGFRYSDDFTGGIIFTIKMYISRALRSKNRLKIIHNTNSGEKFEYEYLLNPQYDEVVATITPDPSVDLRGFNYFNIYIDYKFYGTKAYKIMDDTINFMISADTSSVDINQSYLISPENISYKMVLDTNSKFPVTIVEPLTNELRRFRSQGYTSFSAPDVISSPDDVLINLMKIRLIEVNNNGGVKIQSNNDDKLFLVMSSIPNYSETHNINYHIAAFKEVTIDDASVFYIHNVTNKDENYHPIYTNGWMDAMKRNTGTYFMEERTFNSDIYNPTVRYYKIGNKPSGDDCYFVIVNFKTIEPTDLTTHPKSLTSFAQNEYFNNDDTDVRGLPMVLWKDINTDTYTDELSIKRVRSCMLFKMTAYTNLSYDDTPSASCIGCRKTVFAI